MANILVHLHWFAFTSSRRIKIKEYVLVRIIIRKYNSSEVFVMWKKGLGAENTVATSVWAFGKLV